MGQSKPVKSEHNATITHTNTHTHLRVSTLWKQLTGATNNYC